MTHEQWRAVSANELYEVSDQGRVRRVGGGVLKQNTINTGYLTVSLSKRSIVKRYTVHRLVCTAFLGEPTAKMTVNHKDGNKKNNRLENLEWATYSRNNTHALEIGLRKNPTPRRGEDSPSAKLTAAMVKEIRANPLGLLGKQLAEKFGVSASLISSIQKNQRWREEHPSTVSLPHWRSRKNHCKHGHTYTPESTATDRSGYRTCLICRRQQGKRRSDKPRTGVDKSGLPPLPPRALYAKETT